MIDESSPEPCHDAESSFDSSCTAGPQATRQTALQPESLPKPVTPVSRKDQMQRLFAELEHHHSRPLIESVAQRSQRFAESPIDYLPWLEGGDRACRLAALRAVGQFEPPIDRQVVDFLTESAQNDQDTGIVCAAIEALGKLQITEATSVITECMDDGNERLVPPAALALSRLGVRSIAERLRYLLAYGKPAMVSSAARGLALLSATEAIPDLIESLEESPALKRNLPNQKWLPASRKIIQTLGELKAFGAVPLLKRIARDHIGLRSPALMSLHLLGENITELLVDAYQLRPTRNLYKVAEKTGMIQHVTDLPNVVEFKRALEVSAAAADPRLVINQHRLAESPDLVNLDAEISVVIEHVDDGFVIARHRGLSLLLPGYEISWTRVASARDHLQADDRINVKVLSVDPDTGKILVSRRELLPDPWLQMAKRIPIGTRVHGEITSVAPFGVFVEVMPNIEGLLHRTQFPSETIDRETVFAGNAISVVIAAVDPRARRITLHLPPQ